MRNTRNTHKNLKRYFDSLGGKKYISRYGVATVGNKYKFRLKIN